jgi:hypothetical protein
VTTTRSVRPRAKPVWIEGRCAEHGRRAKRESGERYARIDFFGGYTNENNTYPMGTRGCACSSCAWVRGDRDVPGKTGRSSPRSTLSLSHVAIPDSSAAISGRLPQVRAEAKLGGLEPPAVLAPPRRRRRGGLDSAPAASKLAPTVPIPSLQRIGYGQKIDNETLGAGVSGHFGAEE